VAVVNGGSIYTSTDSGATWTAQANAPSTSWSSIASSADGTRLVAVVNGGKIYTSSTSLGSGVQGSSGQFQYLGNGAWQAVTPTGNFTGNGGGLTNLNASALATGTISASQLPAAVVTNNETGVTLGGTFSGNGSGLTNLNASQLTSGTVPSAALSGDSFVGNGSGLTSLNASNLTSGTVADSLLSANVALRGGPNNFIGNQTVTSGNVGIGTTSPQRLLQVGDATVVGTTGMIRVASRANGGSAARLWDFGCPINPANNLDTTGTNFSFIIQDTATSVPSFLIRWDTHNIGLGTTTPNFPLSFTNVLGDKIALWDSGSGNSFGFGMQSNQLQIHTDATNSDIVFGTGSSTSFAETMRIKGTGNVGIGTNDSTAKLSIAGVTNYNSGLKLTGTSANGVGLALANSASSGHQYSLFSSGTNNSIGAGGFAIYDETAIQWRLVIAPNGNVGFGNTNPTNLLVVGSGTNPAYCDGMTWHSTSDRNRKTDFASVNPQDILEKVAALPITEWRYTNEIGALHLGPMAQDFMAAFHLGTDDKSIGAIDETGVALSAIQGLNKKLEQQAKSKDAEIKELKLKNDSLAARLERLEKLVSKPEGEHEH
jgi:hypothetical protein